MEEITDTHISLCLGKLSLKFGDNDSRMYVKGNPYEWCYFYKLEEDEWKK